MGLSFLKATIADWKIISAMEKQAGKFYSPRKGKERIQSFINQSDVFFIINKKMKIGFISYKREGGRNIVFDGLVILRKFRGRGFATAALEKMIKILGNKHYSLVVHPENSAAIKIYLNLGFVITGWKDNYFGEGEPRLLLKKK